MNGISYDKNNPIAKSLIDKCNEDCGEGPLWDCVLVTSKKDISKSEKTEKIGKLLFYFKKELNEIIGEIK